MKYRKKPVDAVLFDGRRNIPEIGLRMLDDYDIDPEWVCGTCGAGGTHR